MTPSGSTFLNRSVQSIPAFIAESATRWRDLTALWARSQGQFEPLTYAVLMDAVARLAARISEHGGGLEKRVAICLNDRFQFGIAYLATLWSGATAVPLDPMLTPTEVAGILADSESSLFITDASDGWSGKLPTDLRAIGIKGIWPVFSTGDVPIPKPPVIDPESLAVLIFTSGTTGYSKGVMLTHANIVTDIMAIQEMRLLEHSDTLLSVLPMHHAFESTAGFLYPLSIGAQVAYARSLKSNEILDDLKTSKANVILAVPLLYEKMANSIQRKVSDAPFVRRSLFGLLGQLARLGHTVGWKTSGQSLFRSARSRAGLGSLRLVVSGGAGGIL